jgi:hypothetical protein
VAIKNENPRRVETIPISENKKTIGAGHFEKIKEAEAGPGCLSDQAATASVF